MDTSEQVRVRECTRRFRTVEEKRPIVEEAIQPGASVAGVARAHGMNTNQLFTWRRLYQQGRLEAKVGQTPALLPVHVIGASVTEAERSTAAAGRRTPSGMLLRGRCVWSLWVGRTTCLRDRTEGERAAAIYSLIGTAKLNGLDPEAYLRDVSRIAEHPINRYR